MRYLTHSLAAVVVVSATCTVVPAQQQEKKEETVTAQQTSDQATQTLKWDLGKPEFNPPNCPAWAKVETPEWVKPYQGKNGAPEPYRSRDKPMGSPTEGIDRYQANQFVNYRSETAEYLYSDYTPLKVNYVEGTLPSYEKVVDQYTHEDMSDTEKALALLTEAMPDVFRHPGMPPVGPSVPPDRNLMDEELLATGCGWCNEQARVFIRLCQVAGLQGRMIHLFGQNHTIAEFYADGQWVMADASNFFVARDEEGKLLSAAQCHDGGAGQLAYTKAKKKRLMELAAMSDEELNLSGKRAQRFRENCSTFDAEAIGQRDDLTFGVINYPLPQTSQAATE